MSEENPYEPPQATPESNWFMLLIKKWRTVFDKKSDGTTTTLNEFIQGKTAIHYGVVFSIDPENPETLFADIPIREASSDLVRRSQSEVQRVLPEFLAARPDLAKMVVQRSLFVRFRESYSPTAAEIARPVNLGPIPTGGE